MSFNALGPGNRPPIMTLVRGGGSLPPLKANGNGGNGGGMEARVAALETHMEHVRKDLAKLTDLPADIAVLKTKVDALPSKEYLGEKLRNYLGLAVGLMGIMLTAATLVLRYTIGH